MRNWLILAAVGLGLWAGWNHHQGHTWWGGTHVSSQYAGNEVLVYGTTTCAPTKQMLRELGRAGVPFTAYMMDEDPGRMQEMKDKLSRPPYAGRGYVTPIIEVNGEVLPMPDNVSITKVIERLNVAGG